MGHHTAVLQSFRTVSAASPQSLRTVAAVLLLIRNCSIAIHSRAFLLFMQVHLSEKTVVETLSNQRVMYSAMVHVVS